MKNIPVMISGIDFYVPETIVTNDDIATLVDTSDEWIKTRTGISERRVVSGNQTSITMGIEAASRLISKQNTDVASIDLIISATSIPAKAYPAVACEIQAAIGAKNAAAFDITAACSGMIYAMSIAKAYISSGMYKKILLVMTDANSKFVDWSDRSVCCIFGDGAGAMLLEKSTDGKDDIEAIDLTTMGELGEYISLEISGKNCPLVEENEQKPLFIHMEGRDVYKFVMTILPDKIQQTLNKANLTANEIDYFVPHQANMRITDALSERIGFEPDKVIVNIQKYGNTSAASVPIALTESIRNCKIKLPCKAFLTGFGAGMTCGNAIVNLREGIA